jgi:hypothetical protein
VDAGADSLIFLALRVRVNVGDTVVTTAGTYPTFKYFAEGIGAQILEVPYKENGKGLEVDLAALSSAANKSNASLVYVANPDNPTGHVHDSESISSLRRSLPPTTTLIVDEAYIDFSPSHALRLTSRCEEWQNTIQLRTLSKAYGLAGEPLLPVIQPEAHLAHAPFPFKGCASATPSRTRPGSTKRIRCACTSASTTSPTTWRRGSSTLRASPRPSSPRPSHSARSSRPRSSAAASKCSPAPPTSLPSATPRLTRPPRARRSDTPSPPPLRVKIEGYYAPRPARPGISRQRRPADRGAGRGSCCGRTGRRCTGRRTRPCGTCCASRRIQSRCRQAPPPPPPSSPTGPVAAGPLRAPFGPWRRWPIVWPRRVCGERVSE